MAGAYPSAERRGVVYETPFDGDWRGSIFRLLDRTGLAAAISPNLPVLVKPNLVEAIPPPVTTPVELAEAVVLYLQEKLPGREIIVGDGTGSLDYDTYHVFDALGYTAMAARRKIRLVDLNVEPCVTLENRSLKRWPTMHLPKLVMESFLLSLPVLKAHSLAGVTLTMKNMMGACPPKHYCKGGHWKKSAFHTGMQEAVLDLNRYRRPDFNLLDATVGLSEYHLGGPTLDPPPNLIAAGFDPVAIDAYGAGLLGMKWQEIGHIAGADGELGSAGPLRVEKI